MGGFSSNYEGGYLDFDDNPKWMGKEAEKENKYAHLRQKKVYRESKGTNASYLNVLLTPSEHLSPTEQEQRSKLCDIDDENIQLELQIENEVLKVYYENCYIGSIQKVFEKEQIDNSNIVNTFCSLDQKNQKLEIWWDGESFFLSKIDKCT